MVVVRNVRRGTPLLVLLVFGVMGMAAGDAKAEIIAEHDYFTSDGNPFIQPFYADYHIQQTFTTTAAGTITSVDLTVTSQIGDNPGEAPLNLTIYEVVESELNGLQPTGPALSTGSIDADDPQFDGFFIEWVSISMSAFELDVDTTYSLVAEALPSENAYNWYARYANDGEGENIDLYPDGQLAVKSGSGEYGQQSHDLPFRVHAIPEPSTAMVLAGLAITALTRRRSGRSPR